MLLIINADAAGRDANNNKDDNKNDSSRSGESGGNKDDDNDNNRKLETETKQVLLYPRGRINHYPPFSCCLFSLILLSITLVSIHSSTVSILDPTRTILFFVRVEQLVNSRTAHTAANGETIPSDWSYRCRWEGGGGGRACLLCGSMTSTLVCSSSSPEGGRLGVVLRGCMIWPAIKISRRRLQQESSSSSFTFRLQNTNTTPRRH